MDAEPEVRIQYGLEWFQGIGGLSGVMFHGEEHADGGETCGHGQGEFFAGDPFGDEAEDDDESGDEEDGFVEISDHGSDPAAHDDRADDHAGDE